MINPKDLRLLPPLLVALVVAGVVALAVFWPGAPRVSHRDARLFETRSGFEGYVAGLGLETLPVADAIDRLVVQGFECETFKDGNVACFRESRGNICGERQFVDLLLPGTGGRTHRVATRFGRVCL